MDDYYYQYNANVHRGVHTLAEEATEAYEAARQRTGEFYQCTITTRNYFHQKYNRIDQPGRINLGKEILTGG